MTHNEIGNKNAKFITTAKKIQPQRSISVSNQPYHSMGEDEWIETIQPNTSNRMQKRVDWTNMLIYLAMQANNNNIKSI